MEQLIKNDFKLSILKVFSFCNKMVVFTKIHKMAITMKILGIFNGIDSGAALIIDGVVIAAANEERFNRNKLTREFPKASIEFLLNYAGLNQSEIDTIGVAALDGIEDSNMLYSFSTELAEKVKKNIYSEKIALERVAATVERDALMKKDLFLGLKQFGFSIEKFTTCDHHLSHALTSFYPSSFEKALVLVADGRGGFKSTSLWLADKKTGLKQIHAVSELNSVGAFYSFITKALGFTPHRHEGKVTGLAARGTHTELCNVFVSCIRFDAASGNIICEYGDYYLPFIRAELPKLKKLLLNYSKEDIAYAAQYVLEKVLIEYLTFHVILNAPNETINLCLAGGIFANVKLNYEISRLKFVDSIFVAQNMGDGGIALGGAIHSMVSLTGNRTLKMPNVYLGPSFSENFIISECENSDVEYRVYDDQNIPIIIAKLLAEGFIIGWFDGRMEFGPRALGARSILASANNPTINDSLNERLNRTEFMPFAPVTISTLAEKCFQGWDSSDYAAKYMTTCYECKPVMLEKCSATVHVDGTARPQVVFEEDNQKYFNLIKNYYELTQQPCLINTSFNHHEEPIVCTPRDALRSFLKGNVDYLLLNNVLVGSVQTNLK
jgi:carbamoyltransferase